MNKETTPKAQSQALLMTVVLADGVKRISDEMIDKVLAKLMNSWCVKTKQKPSFLVEIGLFVCAFKICG